MRVGLAIGKFDPPHLGHSILIDTALAHCERLIVFIRTYENQRIDAALRKRWLEESHPDVEFTIVDDDPMILPDDVEAQAARARIYLNGVQPDIVFSSEAAETVLAHLLGAKSFSVDRDRKIAPVSSTMICRDPLDNLQYVTPAVRAHFVKRVCVIGAECVGKTTLTQRLAEQFETNWVAEYGKEFAAAKLTAGDLRHWTLDESIHIGREQQRREDEAARVANKILFCDTNTISTAIWHELLLGERPLTWPVPPPKADLYLLLYPDVPYVPSVMRNFEHKRFWMHERIQEEIERTDRLLVILEGEFEEREAQAREAVESVISLSGVAVAPSGPNGR